MRVLFIRPNAGYIVMYPPQPPVGSLALASFLQSRGHTVRVFDHQVERGLMKAVREFRPDAVAVTLLGESSIPDAVKTSRALKALGLPVLWGGHLASAIPELAVRCDFVDYVGISEGEYTLLELLEVIEGKRARETVLGIAYVDENGEYRRTADRPFADLADFPPMDYSLLLMERYMVPQKFTKRPMTMITSKGCPYSCTFCFNSEFHRCQRREYPREMIFGQIKTLAENYGVDHVVFWDEIVSVNRRELNAFCKGIADLQVGISWEAQMRVGVLTREDLEVMHAAGCRKLFFGLESGSAEMRKALRKTFDDSKIDETFRNCREVGIQAGAVFILGLPGETPEQLRETIRLYFRLRPVLTHWSHYLPILGSQLYRTLEADGKISAPTTLETIAQPKIIFQVSANNYSQIPDRELRVVQCFVQWLLLFGKKHGDLDIKTAIRREFINLRSVGLRGLTRGLWNAAKLFCSVVWHVHAYPSIRKKYDLYAENFGRTEWNDA